jgi:putative transposase
MSYWRLFYHATWATKSRQPLILPEFEQAVYRVIIAKAKSLDALVYAIGGTEDHIHLVASIPPDIALNSAIGQVKGNSSHFINSVIHPDFEFSWQREYGIVSFGSKQLPMVIEYVHNQKAHHAENRLFTALEKAENAGRRCPPRG